MTRIVDASVAVKWYLDEDGSDAARRILASDELLVAPQHILAEVGNVAWLRSNKGDISREQAVEILRELPGAFLALVPVQDLIVRAVEIAQDIGETVYDTLYLAAAERWDAPFVTDDRKLLSAAERTIWAGTVMPLIAPA